MSFAKFEIDVSPIGRGSKVVVNGNDVTNTVKAMALFAHVSEPTILQLHTYGEGRIVGEGIVEIHVEDPTKVGQFLREVSREEVDRRAMGRGGWGVEGTLTDHVVETLLEMLNETQPGPHS